MVLDEIMGFGSNVLNGLVDAVPDWQTSLDVSKVRELIKTLQAWNNWIPLSELAICIGIAVGLWVVLQVIAAALVAVETIKP